MSYVIFYLVSLFASIAFSSNFRVGVFGVLAALTISCGTILILDRYSYKWLSYLLFFSISITSLFGFTEALTGSHAASTSFFLYGFAFYTASIAYLNYNNNLTLFDTLKVSNPLLLFTGPIALFVKPIHHKKISQRILYFLPFLTIGIFYFQIIGAPLSHYMFLLNETDIFSAIIFAVIFELFVYANFCGLSLIVYSISGIIGFKVPLNFRQPFSATNLVEFWKGWHVSLSSVLKTLFYKPFRETIGLFGALFLVFFSSSMWHGITFNFMVWGFIHACCFYLTLKVLNSKIAFACLLTFPLMIIAVVFGRLIFADSRTERLLQKLTFDFEGFAALNHIFLAPAVSNIAISLGIFLILIELFFQKNKFVRKRNYKHLRTPLAQFLIIPCILMLAMNVGGDFAIYGQR